MTDSLNVDNPKNIEEEWHHVITMTELEGLKRSIHITYDVVGVQMAIDVAVGMVRKKSKIKGFRKGKAPEALVKIHCVEEIDNTAKALLAQEGFMHACFEQKIQPLCKPEFKNIEICIDGSFECDIELEVNPVINPSGYIGIPLTKPEIDHEKILNDFMDNVRSQHCTEVKLDTVQDGCTIYVDFNVKKLDKFSISHGKDHCFVINKGQEAPFGENLIGKLVGDEIEEKIVMSKDAEEYAGQDAIAYIKINSIVTKVPPTDKELVERIKAPSFEDLMKACQERVDLDVKVKERQALEEEMVDKLVNMFVFDIPESWVLDERKYIVDRLGVDLGTIDSELKDHIDTMAGRNIRRTFILEAIYDTEKELALTEEEFENWIEGEANIKGVSPLIIKKRLKEDNVRDSVMGALRHKKVMNFLVSNANIIEKDNNSSDLAMQSETIEIPENPLG
ncbi:MAG: trigger factor [Candidatus Hodarchaeales archaeon]|jgi:trigger factor